MGATSDPLAAIERVYRSELPRFVRVATAIAGDRDAAFDVVQDAFANAVKSRSTFRGDGPLDAWLWRMVVNAALQARRMRPLEQPTDAATFSANGAGEASSASLRVPLEQLPERQRLVVFLRYYADLDYRAIGEVLGIQTGTVSATLNAAHATLRRAFEEVEH